MEKKFIESVLHYAPRYIQMLIVEKKISAVAANELIGLPEATQIKIAKKAVKKKWSRKKLLEYLDEKFEEPDYWQQALNFENAFKSKQKQWIDYLLYIQMREVLSFHSQGDITLFMELIKQTQEYEIRAYDHLKEYLEKKSLTKIEL
ncbi:MAG: hypothetical protein HYW50_00400 [Candidatus Diapherotrites archaeon]|nr:hypothetical protein [Candidatus Diapherotrites archaeon]